MACLWRDGGGLFYLRSRDAHEGPSYFAEMVRCEDYSIVAFAMLIVRCCVDVGKLGHLASR
jgi:hypothetical protein